LFTRIELEDVIRISVEMTNSLSGNGNMEIKVAVLSDLGKAVVIYLPTMISEILHARTNDEHIHH